MNLSVLSLRNQFAWIGGRNLGLRVVDQLKTWAGEAGCYKIILDCAAHNVPFYNKLGFVKKEEQMAFYY